MGFRPEPVLDIVRGLSAFTSAYILATQVFVVFRELYVDTCDYCKGAGRVVCPHCGGTATLRKRQGEFHKTQMTVVDSKVSDVYPCIHCGPLTVYDLKDQATDVEEEAFDIMDNLKAVYAGRPRPNRMPILAGLVPCPQCLNNPKVRRHTPNFARVFRMEEPWDYKITMRTGFRGRSQLRPQQYIEYPSRQPRVDEMDGDYIASEWKAKLEEELEKDRRKKEGLEDWEKDELGDTIEQAKPVDPEDQIGKGSEWSARGQLNAGDYVTRFVDDSDTDDE